MRRKWIRRLAVAALVVLAAAALRLTLLRPEPVPVTVFRTARGRVEETVTNSRAGVVESRLRARLSPPIGGRVAAIEVREGDRVEAGQALLRLDAADLEARLALERRGLEAALAAGREACLRADQAGRELARNRGLAAGGIISDELLDQLASARDAADASCAAARARVAQARAAVEAAEVELGKATLRAPFAGVVAGIGTEVGEWITPSPPGVPLPPVADVVDPEAIHVTAYLDEIDVERVRVGLPARITLDAYPGRSFPGTVTRVSAVVSAAEEQNRTLEIEARLADEDFARALKPGLTADVEVILDARDGVLRVPSYAILQGGRVLVVRDGELVAAEVATGLKNWEFTEIASGLEPGDPVVVSLDRAEVEAGARARIAGETDR